jgi:hypothetical protein
MKHKIDGYFRYIDDNLLAHKSTYTNINDILQEFNNVCSNLEFTLEAEKNNSINFLDITIKRCMTKLDCNFKISIYRKPTNKDCIIPFSSCHPTEQNYLPLNISTTAYEHTVCNPMKNNLRHKNNTILHNNQFNVEILDDINRGKRTNRTDRNSTTPILFRYVEKETKFVTKIFKNTNINISYKANTTIQKLLAYNKQKDIDKYGKSGIYVLECLDGGKRYLRQTGRPFWIRFKEHFSSHKTKIKILSLQNIYE